MTFHRPHILTDIDHCVADAAWRDHLIGAPGGWDTYHSEAVHDKPALATVALLKALSPQYDLIGLTSRPEKWYGLTMNWLVEHDVALDHLLMRGAEDYRPSPAVKVDLALQHFGSPVAVVRQVACVIDNRDDVLAAFRALGVTTMQISIGRNAACVQS